MTLSRFRMEQLLAQQNTTQAYKKKDNHFVDDKTAQDILSQVARMKARGSGYNTIRQVLGHHQPKQAPESISAELNYSIWNDLVHYFKQF